MWRMASTAPRAAQVSQAFLQLDEHSQLSIFLISMPTRSFDTLLASASCTRVLASIDQGRRVRAPLRPRA